MATTHDHQVRSGSVRLTRRGVAVVVAAGILMVVAVLLDRREALYIALFLLLLCALSLFSVRLRRPRVRMHRSFSHRSVTIGEAVGVRTVLDGAESLSSASGWREQVPPSFGADPSGTMPDRSAGERDQDRRMLTYRIRSVARGRFRIGPFWVSHGDPFGLVTAQKAVGGPTDLIVTPAVTPLETARIRNASGDGVSTQRHQHTNPRADELIARDYRPGDPMRRVHWRQTARMGTLMVRQEEQQGDPEACLLLDTARHRRQAGEAVTAGQFERMVELTASIGAMLLDAGHALALIESTGAAPQHRGVLPLTTHVAVGDRTELLERLAEVERVQVPNDHDAIGALEAALRRAGGIAPVFAVLGSVSETAARRLAALNVRADPRVVFLPNQAAAETGNPASPAGILGNAGWRLIGFDEHTGVDEIWSPMMQQAAGMSEGGRVGA